MASSITAIMIVVNIPSTTDNVWFSCAAYFAYLFSLYVPFITNFARIEKSTRIVLSIPVYLTLDHTSSLFQKMLVSRFAVCGLAAWCVVLSIFRSIFCAAINTCIRNNVRIAVPFTGLIVMRRHKTVASSLLKSIIAPLFTSGLAICTGRSCTQLTRLRYRYNFTLRTIIDPCLLRYFIYWNSSHHTVINY